MARVILEFEDEQQAQAFVDDLAHYGYVTFGDSEFESYGGATIAEDSEVQPAPPMTEAEQRKARRESKQATSRLRLADYVDRQTGDFRTKDVF